MGGSTQDLPGSPLLLPLPRCMSLRLAGRTGSIAFLTGAPGAPATRHQPSISGAVAFLCPAKPCGPFGGTVALLWFSLQLDPTLKCQVIHFVLAVFILKCAEGREKVEGGLRDKRGGNRKAHFFRLGRGEYLRTVHVLRLSILIWYW